MRALLALFLGFALSSEAFAFDGASTMKQYDHARPGCRQGELDGAQITAKQSAEQCALLDKLGGELKAHGYCWDASEVEWTAPGEVDTVGSRCPATENPE